VFLFLHNEDEDLGGIIILIAFVWSRIWRGGFYEK